jgi:hypothetical protein
LFYLAHAEGRFERIDFLFDRIDLMKKRGFDSRKAVDSLLQVDQGAGLGKDRHSC